MPKVYDLIIVGAGPAGLTAAKFAGENGLRVALLERKTTIYEIKRACAHMFAMTNESFFGERMFYNESSRRFCYPINGFSIRYEGPIKNLYAWQVYSADRHKLELGNAEEGRKIGDKGRLTFVFDKSTLLKNLLEDVEKAGVEVFSGINVVDARKEGEVIKVITPGRIFEGTFLIAADGCNSRLDQRMGMNEGRKYYGTLTGFHIDLEDVEPADPDTLVIVMSGGTTHNIPTFYGMQPKAKEGVYEISAGGLYHPMNDWIRELHYFTKESEFAPWFKKAKKIKELAVVENFLEPLKEPFKDNCLFIGDTAWMQEIECNGAIMTGWKAANVISLAMVEGKRGKEAVMPYLEWWQKNYYYMYDHIHYLRGIARPYVLSEDDINFMFSLIKEKLPPVLNPYTAPQHMASILAKTVPIIQQQRPEMLLKMKKLGTSPIEDLLLAQIRVGFPNRLV